MSLFQFRAFVQLGLNPRDLIDYPLQERALPFRMGLLLRICMPRKAPMLVAQILDPGRDTVLSATFAECVCQTLHTPVWL